MAYQGMKFNGPAIEIDSVESFFRARLGEIDKRNQITVTYFSGFLHEIESDHSVAEHLVIHSNLFKPDGTV